MQMEVDDLLRVQRDKHPHLAEPIPWHGNEPAERYGGTHAPKPTRVDTSEVLPVDEVERIMARHRKFAHDNFSPEEADLIIRDLENWRQHPIADPHIRRKGVDASAFLSQVRWFHDAMTKAVREGLSGVRSKDPRAKKQAYKLIWKAKEILDRGKMSLSELETIRELYIDVFGEWQSHYRKNSRDLQTPTLLNHGHFGERSNNAAGVLDVHQSGLLDPDERHFPFMGPSITTHDYDHTSRLATEYAPAFHSYLAAVDRRIDFAEAISAFAKLLSPRERQLLESVRFAARWENGWAPTAEHTLEATRPSPNEWLSLDKNLIDATIRVEEERGNTVWRHEVIQVVSQFRKFISNYLAWLPNGELRKRNAPFARKLNQYAVEHWGNIIQQHVVRYLGARTSAATAADQLTLSPEEVLALIKVDPKAPTEPTIWESPSTPPLVALSPGFLMERTQGLRQFVEAFIHEQ